MLRSTKTENGLVRGLPGANTRITVYKGIPFAAPPVGENRWRAPQPAANWEGTRDCFKFGPISFQDTPGLGTDIYCREWHVDPEIEMSEDCLYLNIWTPANATTDKLPVLVWYFGGGLQWGYPSEMEFDGEHLAKQGIVVVSVNYRLAALGFLSHPELTKNQPEGYANFGNLDQQAGLKWVKRNIENFGGDPSRITIAGQSAGGGSTMTQLTCRENYDDISGAIILSGMIRDPFTKMSLIIPMDLQSAEKNGEEFFEYLGVKTLEEARKLDASYIREKYAEYRMSHPMFATIVDGSFVKEDPYLAICNGHHAPVPIISGNTADEFYAGITANTKEELEQKAVDAFGDKASVFLNFPEVKNATGNRYGFISGIEPAIKGAFMRESMRPQGSPCYYYRFNPDIPGWDNPGTFHSVDLWFFFDNLDKCWRPFKGRHYDLARQMSGYWINFITTGNPNGKDRNGEDLPVWKPYNTGVDNEMEFTRDGAVAKVGNSDLVRFLARVNAGINGTINPYLPSWEYIPDGEPYVFNDRVYIYGSHDYFKGEVFCLGDYVSWSAPIYDLGDWRYEGVIYKATDDPYNKDRHMALYAPDVTVGPDGKYYLFYVLDKVGNVSVAVCDEPAGKYKFLGYVHYEDGTLLGDREGDEPQFDPGVLTEGEKTYLFTGFSGQRDDSRHGSMVTVLGPDMLTIIKEPHIVVPSTMYSQGTDFEGHAFFEASSIRKRNGKYYMIYSSQVMHELCYAISDKPDEGYKYGGVIVSNADIGISSYKESAKPVARPSNNHGSIVQIGDEWHIFYHRHTNDTWYSRQGSAERISFNDDGSINQVEMTSSGMSCIPLSDRNEYKANIVCNMIPDKMPESFFAPDNRPYITQDGSDGEVCDPYITNVNSSYTLGFKYFDFKDVKGLYIKVRGYAKGKVFVRTEPDGEILGEIALDFANIWTRFEGHFDIPNGTHALYLTPDCSGFSLGGFGFIH